MFRIELSFYSCNFIYRHMLLSWLNIQLRFFKLHIPLTDKLISDKLCIVVVFLIRNYTISCGNTIRYLGIISQTWDTVSIKRRIFLVRIFAEATLVGNIYKLFPNNFLLTSERRNQYDSFYCTVYYFCGFCR